MLTVALTILGLIAACVIVWFGVRRTRAVQRVSNQLSGPVEQMQEQLLLTADSAVDRLDDKIAQMEILLAEIDRRSTLLAQHSQRQQALLQQADQQQKQLAESFQSQRRQLEQEFASQRQVLGKLQERQPAPLLAVHPVERVTDVSPKLAASLIITPEPETRLGDEIHRPKVLKPARAAENAGGQHLMRQGKDKRTTILDMAEQGFSVTDIAQKMGIGKGEVMLLIKLRKKTAP